MYNGSTIGFACKSAEEVEAWHAAGFANGGTTCEDPPGVREGATGKLTLANLRDPDGHKLCVANTVTQVLADAAVRDARDFCSELRAGPMPLHAMSPVHCSLYAPFSVTP